MLADYRQERVAVGLELARADAGDRAQLRTESPGRAAAISRSTASWKIT